MTRFNLTVFLVTVLVTQAFPQPSISFTFDDGITTDMPGYTFEQWNAMLLDHLDRAGIKTVFFVTGRNKLDGKGQFLLKSWDDKGHKISNHTFSHLNYGSQNISLETFGEEFLKNDKIIKKYKNYFPLFRFPYLKEGDTKEKVDGFRSLLRQHGYKNGYVTIDASDWYIDSRLVKRLRENLNTDLQGFREFYLDHLYERALYYEKLSLELTGRHIKHTLLLHHNLTSALFLGDAIKMFKEKGWEITSAQEAYQDEIFNANPSNVPAGESLIWALAKESGKFEGILRYPAEDSKYEKDKMDNLGL